MKNIHILPTDYKYSRLYFNINDKEFQICEIEKQSTLLKPNRHIYITNDEKPKARDLSLYQNKIHKCYEDIIGDEFKKIILTTDQDLIKDGVQSIDDEFLQWFVKNPSCEQIEVQKWFDGVDFLEYKIIIPKEEPKQETTFEDVLNESLAKGKLILEELKAINAKQETLEEEMGKKVAEYCKQYAGTDKYDVAMLAIEFGYNLNLD